MSGDLTSSIQNNVSASENNYGNAGRAYYQAQTDRTNAQANAATQQGQSHTDASKQYSQKLDASQNQLTQDLANSKTQQDIQDADQRAKQRMEQANQENKSATDAADKKYNDDIKRSNEKFQDQAKKIQEDHAKNQPDNNKLDQDLRELNDVIQEGIRQAMAGQAITVALPAIFGVVWADAMSISPPHCVAPGNANNPTLKAPHHPTPTATPNPPTPTGPGIPFATFIPACMAIPTICQVDGGKLKTKPTIKFGGNVPAVKNDALKFKNKCCHPQDGNTKITLGSAVVKIGSTDAAFGGCATQICMPAYPTVILPTPPKVSPIIKIGVAPKPATPTPLAFPMVAAADAADAKAKADAGGGGLKGMLKKAVEDKFKLIVNLLQGKTGIPIVDDVLDIYIAMKEYSSGMSGVLQGGPEGPGFKDGDNKVTGYKFLDDSIAPASQLPAFVRGFPGAFQGGFFAG